MICPVRYHKVTALFAVAIRTLVVMGQPHNLDKADYFSLQSSRIPALGAKEGCRNNEQRGAVGVPYGHQNWELHQQ